MQFEINVLVYFTEVIFYQGTALLSNAIYWSDIYADNDLDAFQQTQFYLCVMDPKMEMKWW